ncbi:MAG: Asp-tRNA(Asn)/Glu-tRNA(Gln) amidotransferase subunit GatA [Planctomycetes bacterium]|nr:Asp-tRNA(Asn)/Glu-tRNA(Gln) amidotransferase subunit GatA [Planctomycetota bacterium]
MEIRDRIRRGEMSALEAVDEALRQLDVVNPRLQAALQIFPDGARTAAAAIDRRLAAGEDAGPLAGVPFTVKDNFCTLEGHTTAGSRILESFASPYDATAVRKLKEAGAVCVAKTNLDEFGMGSSTENSAFHVTRNPWKTTHVPGGSSGGAAALAVSTGGMIHLGSDTGGSIRQPSACCGASGLKPTYGRVSRYGLVAFASSLDQIGPIQSSALDCALVLETIAGADPMDSTSRDLPVPRYADEAQQDIRGLRLGVPAEYFPEGIEAEVEEKVRAAIEVFREMGAEVRDVSLPHTRYANPAYVLVSAAEASSNLARYDGVHYGRRSVSASGLVDMYCRSRGEGFGAEVKRRILIGTFVLSSGYYDAYYLTALRVRNLIRQDFEKVYREVDAVVCPTSPVPAFPLGDRIDDPLKLYAVDVLTVPANLASLPGMSIPCGFTSEALPVGLQIYGRPMQDEIVLRLACAYQARTDHHLRAPPVCGWRGGEEGG